MAMRALVLGCLLVATTARAMPIDDDFVRGKRWAGPADRCKQGTWQEVTKCLQQFARVSEVFRDDTSRLVRVGIPNQTDFGRFLYVLRDGKWSLGGSHNSEGELLEVQHIRARGHTGWLLTFREVTATWIAVGETSVPAKMLQTEAVLCDGLDSACTNVIIACDVYLRGRAVRTFRGTLKIEAIDLVVDGDRKVGEGCAPPERFQLAWGQRR